MIKSFVDKLYPIIKKGILRMFSAQVINKVIVMVSNMVVTRLLTKPEYGVWGYVLNVYSYASLITGLGLLSGSFQFGAENRDNSDKYRFYKYCLVVGLIINAFISAIFAFSTFFVQVSIEGSAPYIRLYMPVLLIEYAYDILLTVLRCDSRIKEYARSLNIHSAIVAFFTCLGALFGVGGIILGKYVAAILSGLYVFVCVRTDINPIRLAGKLDKPQVSSLWHYSLFTGLSSALNRLLYLLDVSMIAAMIQSPTDVANYKVATMIPNSLTFIPSSVVICVLPDIVAHNNDFKWLKKHLKKAYLGLFIFNLFIFLILELLAPIIITIISGKQYLPSVQPFRILVLGYFISGTFRSLSSNILAGLRRVNYNMFSSLFVGLLDIALNRVLIERGSINGAAMATLLTEIVASILAFGYLCYVLKNERVVKGVKKVGD